MAKAKSANRLLRPLYFWGLLFSLVVHGLVVMHLIAESQRQRGLPTKMRPISVAIQLAPQATETTKAASPPKPKAAAVPPPPKLPPPVVAKAVEQPAPVTPQKPVQETRKRVPPVTTPPASPPKAVADTPPPAEATPAKIPTAEEIAAEGERGLMNHIRARWLRPPRLNPKLQCVVRVQIEPDGQIVSVTLVKGSGNAAFDDSVIRAIYKSDPLPVSKPGAPKGPVLTLTFGGEFLI